MSHAAIAAHAPAQHDIMTDCGRGQVHRCGDKGTTSSSGPCRTSSQGVAAAGANRPSVATRNKAAARSNDVRKCAAINADLQHAAVKGALQVVVLAESQLRRGEHDGDDWRVEALVAYYCRIINKSGIGQRIGNWRRHSGIGSHP